MKYPSFIYSLIRQGKDEKKRHEDDYEEYPEKRVAFHFGEDIKAVEEKLYEHDLILEYKKQKDVKK